MNHSVYLKMLSESRRSGGELTISYLGPDEHFTFDDETQKVIVPVSERELLDYPTAAAMLSKSEQALRDLVHKGKGPITSKIGSRVYFTPADLKSYANRHRQLSPNQSIVDTVINRKRGRPTVEEQAVLEKMST